MGNRRKSTGIGAGEKEVERDKRENAGNSVRKNTAQMFEMMVSKV